MHFQPWKAEFSFRILFSDLITMNRARYFLWLKKSTCKLRQAWKIACVEQKNLCSEIMALPIIRKKLKTSAIKLFFLPKLSNYKCDYILLMAPKNKEFHFDKLGVTLGETQTSILWSLKRDLTAIVHLSEITPGFLAPIKKGAKR